MDARSPAGEPADTDVPLQDVFDVVTEPEIEDLAELAALLCGASAAVVTLTRDGRQCFKAGSGLAELPGDVSYSDSVAAGKLVAATEGPASAHAGDEYFAAGFLVTKDGPARFFAGVPLAVSGAVAGTLCVADTRAREPGEAESAALRRLGRQAAALLEARTALAGAPPAGESPVRKAPAGESPARESPFRESAAAGADVREADVPEVDVPDGERFFALSPDLLCVVDRGGVFRRVNAAFERILGFAAGEVRGKRALDYLHPDDRAIAEGALARLDAAHPVANFAGRMCCRDSSYESIFWALALHGDRIYMAGHDISRRVRAEEEALASRLFIQSTLDALEIQIAVLDESGKIIAVNEAWEKFGRENDGVPVSCGAGANYVEVCLAAKGNCTEGAREVAQGIRDVMAGRTAIFNREYPCHSETRQRWFNVCVTRFRSGGDTGLLHIAVAHTNITERKQTEERIRVSETNLALAQEIAHLGSWEVDLTNTEDISANRRHWSDEVFRIFGYNPGEIEASYSNFMAAIHPEDRAKVERVYDAAVHEGAPYFVEYRVLRPDGTVHFVRGKSETDRDAATGRPVKMVGTVQDITEQKEAEAAIVRNSELLRAVTEGTSDSIFAKDLQGRYLMMNSAGAQVIGKSAAETLGRTDAELFPSATADVFTDSDRRILERGIIETHEQTSVIDGVETTFQTTKGPLYGPDGEVTGIAGVSRDITERKLAEAMLRESEMRYRALSDAAPDDVFIVDREGRMLYINELAAQRLGLPAQQIVGKPQEELFPEAAAQANQKTIGRVIATGKPFYEETCRTFRQQEIWLGTWLVPLRDPAGNVAEVMGVARDITTQKQAEAQLRSIHDELEARVQERTTELAHANRQLQEELQERQRTEAALRDAQQMLRHVMDHIPQAIFWKDRNSDYLGANYRLAVDAGYNSAEDLKGKNDRDMPWAGYAADYQADDRQVMEKDRAKLNIEEPLLRADGSSAWLRTNKIPLHDSEGQVVGVLCTYEDITEQKLAETAIIDARREADAANQAKSEFLSRMSHELRTPLNAILGFGQILERKELVPLAKESVGYILKAGQHLLDLINEVLDISRVEAGGIDLSLESVPLHEMVRETCVMLRTQAAERQIELDENGVSGNVYVRADRQRLKQVLINLLSNAIKYNREGGRVHVTWEHEAEGRIAIAVSDTGPGLSPMDLQKLFTPFERLNARNSEIEGTGLGLVLTQRLVRAMGGDLSVRSTVGRGTTFVIELPQEAPPADLPKATGPEAGSAGGTEKGVASETLCILCIEDRPADLDFLRTALQDGRHVKLLSAMGAAAGLDMARRLEPNLILLDLELAEGAAEDVLARLRQSALTREIPVIIVCEGRDGNAGGGEGGPGERVQALLAAGAGDWLARPLERDRLVHVVNKFLPPAPGAGGEMTISREP